MSIPTGPTSWDGSLHPPASLASLGWQYSSYSPPKEPFVRLAEEQVDVFN